MPIKMLNFPENSGLVCLMKPLAEGAMKSAQKYPTEWWPKLMNNYPVENLSKTSVTLVMEDNPKRKVVFFAEIVDGKFEYSVMETSYFPSLPIDGGFYLILP